MKLIFKVETYREPADLDAQITDLDNWPRITGLAWVVVNDEGKLVRGFQFKVKHDVDPPDLPEEIAKVIADQGHPAKQIVAKFLSDYDVCDTIVAHGFKLNYSILAAEAIRYGLRAKTKIADDRRICTQTGIEEVYEAESETRNLPDLYYSLFGEFIDDDLTPMQVLQVLEKVVEELVYRGIVRPVETVED